MTGWNLKGFVLGEDNHEEENMIVMQVFFFFFFFFFCLQAQRTERLPTTSKKNMNFSIIILELFNKQQRVPEPYHISWLTPVLNFKERLYLKV